MHEENAMTEKGLLSPDYRENDDSKESGLRPLYLKDFQGQDPIKKNLSVFIKAARERAESLDHVFLSGPPGLGKTTLAGIVANEMGAEFKITSAPALEKPKDLAGILTTLNKSAVFFIDEIHRLKPALEEMLYVAMEDFALDWVIGQGPSARTVRIPLEPFTLIGATTKAGLVASPLYNRFGIGIRMEFYTLEEIMTIINRSAVILRVDINSDAAKLLAHSSRGTPRVANRLLKRMRDFAQVEGEGKVSRQIVETGLARLEIDRYGLEKHDRQILRIVIEQYGGGPVGAETLAISVGEAPESLEDFYEPYLIQQGFLQRTPRGRVATALAYKHLSIEMGGDEDQRLPF
jgi:Holliday junction DNA helicase RuvB